MKRTRLVRRTGLRPVSARRRALLPARRALVARLLAEQPVCERCCQERSVDVHERRPRSQASSLLDESVMAAVCRGCHDDLHRNPAVAYATGWLIRRGDS